MNRLAVTLMSLSLLASACSPASRTRSEASPQMLSVNDIRMVAPALEKYTQDRLLGEVWQRLHLREELPRRHDPERQPGAAIHPASEVCQVSRHEVGGVDDDRRGEKWPILRRQLRRREPLDSGRRRLPAHSNRAEVPLEAGQSRRSLRLEIPFGLDDRKGRGQERDAAGRSQLDQERRESERAVCGGEENVGVEEDTKVSHARDGAARPASTPSAGGAPPAHAG